MAISKDKLKKSAASSYLSSTEPEKEQEPQPTIREKKITTSFFISPSLHEDAKRYARYTGRSIGIFLNDVLAEFLEAHRDELQEYDKFYAQLEAKQRAKKKQT